MLIDMHVHTDVSSPCSHIEPERMIQRALEIGLDAVCVTEHEKIEGAELSAELGRRYGFPVFRGVEVYTEFGDILVYGLYRDAPSWNTPFDELLAMCEEAGAAMVPAHSCRVNREMERIHGIERVEYLLGNVTAIETHNGGCTPEGNRACQEMAAEYGLPGIGGSDAHFEFQIGRCVTVFEGDIGSDAELVAALKTGRYKGAYTDWNSRTDYLKI